MGSNDLAAPRHSSAVHLADEILELAARLITHFHVGHVVIGLPICRHGHGLDYDYNVRVTQINQLLTSGVRHSERVSMWCHRQLINPRFICKDGVHLNVHGMVVYYSSLRGAILKALRATGR